MKTRFLDSETIRGWTKVHPLRNLAFLLLDYLTAGILLSGGILLLVNVDLPGGAWWWAIPVALGIGLLIGAVQHRIALMGHEASHRLLYPDRFLNDLFADLLCFAPLFTMYAQYRARHLAHHLYPNHPERDTNLAGDRGKNQYDRFPLSKREFLIRYGLRFFWPPAMISNLVELIRVALSAHSGAPARRPLFRNASLYAVVYFVLLIVVLDQARTVGPGLLLAGAPVLWLTAVGIWSVLPKTWFYDPGGNLAYSPKLSGLFRFSFYTLVFVLINALEIVTGAWIGGYLLLFWILPLLTVFPHLMLVRELFQHANADQGEITNSRVVRVGPFLRWALMGYGNDIHIVHHLYPNIPHYHLDEAHQEMCRQSEEYRDEVEETFGAFRSGDERPCLLDVLASNDSKGDRSPG